MANGELIWDGYGLYLIAEDGTEIEIEWTWIVIEIPLDIFDLINTVLIVNEAVKE